jgi:hypothetical protein
VPGIPHREFEQLAIVGPLDRLIEPVAKFRARNFAHLEFGEHDRGHQESKTRNGSRLWWLRRQYVASSMGCWFRTMPGSSVLSPAAAADELAIPHRDGIQHRISQSAAAQDCTIAARRRRSINLWILPVAVFGNSSAT